MITLMSLSRLKLMETNGTIAPIVIYLLPRVLLHVGHSSCRNMFYKETVNWILRVINSSDEFRKNKVINFMYQKTKFVSKLF